MSLFKQILTILAVATLLGIASACKPSEIAPTSIKIRSAANQCEADVTNVHLVQILSRAIGRIKSANFDGREDRFLGVAEGMIVAGNDEFIWQGAGIGPKADDKKSELKYVVVPELALLSRAVSTTNALEDCKLWRKLVADWETGVARTNRGAN